MALIKRVLLFFLSLLGIIVLLIGATTSYSEVVYEYETNEKHFRFYTINWIVEKNDSGQPYVCGTKVSTFDNSGRKFIIEYYYLIKSDNTIVTRFEVRGMQMSVVDPDTQKLDIFDIKLYGSIITKDDKNILAGIRGNDPMYMGVGAEFNELDVQGNTSIFKTLYKGKYDLEIYTIPGASFKVPIKLNFEYRKEHEYIIDNCIAQLLVDYKKNKSEKKIINNYENSTYNIIYEAI